MINERDRAIPTSRIWRDDASPSRRGGERMHRAHGGAFPDLPQHHGDGVRETLREIGARIPLEVHEVPSGTPVLDWTVPDEWNIRDAYVATADGERVVDFRSSNLHVVSYSEPVRATMTLAELRPHLHTHPERPGLDPVSNVVLRRDVGLLPCAAPARRARGRDVRGRDRQHARARLADVRGALPAGRASTTRCCSPLTSAIRRSRTTTSRESRC